MEKEALKSYVELLQWEERFYKEKYRVKWLKEGDANTTFFHRKMKTHHVQNKILTLTTMKE